MYLQYYINGKSNKVYTTKKESPLGLATQSAHPARFSPDDKYSRQKILLKKCFGLLPTQQPPPKRCGKKQVKHNFRSPFLENNIVHGSSQSNSPTSKSWLL